MTRNVGAIYLLVMTVVTISGCLGSSVQSEFGAEIVASDLGFVSKFQFTPNGEIIYGELDSGIVTIIQRNGELVMGKKYDISNSRGERGLLNIMLEDGTNRLIACLTTDNVIAVMREDELLFAVNDGYQHNGCALEQDSNSIYVAIGDITDSSLPQREGDFHGKLIRINKQTLDAEIVASGLRNPYGMAFDNNNLYLVDTGPTCCNKLLKFEEGTDYGWPDTELQSKDPVYEFDDVTPTAVAYCPATQYGSIPEATLFIGTLNFYSNSGGGVRAFDVFNGTSKNIISGLGAVTDVKCGPDGRLYVASDGSIFKLIKNGGSMDFGAITSNIKGMVKSTF